MNFRASFARVDRILMGRVGDVAHLDIAGDGTQLTEIIGQFDGPQQQPHMGTLRTNVIESMFTVEASVDLTGVVRGTSQLVYLADVYEIVEILPDSTGVTELVLRPVPS